MEDDKLVYCNVEILEGDDYTDCDLCLLYHEEPTGKSFKTFMIGLTNIEMCKKHFVESFEIEEIKDDESEYEYEDETIIVGKTADGDV